MQPTTKEEIDAIIANNRLICEFMGWEFREDPKFEYMAYFEGNQMWCDNLIGLNKMFLEGFKYHKDWNKLMECWHRFRSLELCNISDGVTHTNYVEDIIMEMGHGDIKTTYKVLVEAINWYNSTKNNKP